MTNKSERKINMNFNINFTKAKRNYMVLTFDDEKMVDGKLEEYEKVIHVGMPKKRVFTALMNMKDLATQKDDAQTQQEKDKLDREIIDEMYELTAEILSNNMKKERISTEWVEDQFTTEELKKFLEQYSKFANGEATNPN